MAGEKVWGLSKKAADYGPAPDPTVRCDACRYMLPRAALGSCKLVRGMIRGQDSCREFRPLPRKADAA